MGVGSLTLVDRHSRSYEPAHGDLVTRGPRLHKIRTKQASKSGAPTVHPRPARLPRNLLQAPDLRRLLAIFGEQVSRRTLADSNGSRRSEKPEIPRVLTHRGGSDTIPSTAGAVAEWSIVPVLKAVRL